MFLRYIITAFIGLITWNSFAFDVPVDNKQFIYGLGTDVTYGQAQKSAMADIVMKLSTRITAKSQITQTKENNQTQTRATQKTEAVSRGIELPNVEVVASEEKLGNWYVLVRAERKLVQRSIKHQLVNLNDDLLFALEEFNGKYTPSCFYALSDEASNKEKLNELIPAYVGSGISDGSEDEFYQTLNTFDRTFKKCKKRNRYILTFSELVSSEFKISTIKFLKNNGFYVVSSGENTGVVQFNIKKKQTLAYKSHLTILNTEILVFDETDTLKYQESFKVKSSSFESKSQSLARAEKSLLKKIKLNN